MTHTIYRFLFILLLSAAGGCTVSKDLAVQSVTIADTFRNARSADTATIADLPYNKFFSDGALLQLIDRAIQKNYDMQLALRNIESAQRVLAQTKWGYAPDARLLATASTSRPSDNSLNGLSLKEFLGTKHIEDFTTALVLSWEADIWGKVKNQKRSAFASYLQTDEARKIVQTDIVTGVSKGYYNLLMLDAQLQVARKNLALNDSTLRIIRLQFEAGQLTSLAIQQAEAQRLEAAKLVPELEKNINIQENALSILAGDFPAATERNLALDQLSFENNLATGVPASLVSRRPDVRSSELALTIANANLGITKAAMYPSLSITATGGVNAFKASNWFNIPASLFGTAAASIAQPLIQKKQLKTQYELAKLEREKTILRFRQSVLYAVGEVTDALIKIGKLKNQYEIAELRVTTLQLAIQNANLLFQNGMANYLEVITAQSNVLQSELELTILKRDRLAAGVELYTALGGGWK
ncbi:MAG: efflux transporter outer membrane subunit [Chitinophagaceae bacterium]|nr:efflux transporter outer membrane subunit [Chitinophagaceae bacterium]